MAEFLDDFGIVGAVTGKRPNDDDRLEALVVTEPVVLDVCLASVVVLGHTGSPAADVHLPVGTRESGSTMLGRRKAPEQGNTAFCSWRVVVHDRPQFGAGARLND